MACIVMAEGLAGVYPTLRPRSDGKRTLSKKRNQVSVRPPCLRPCERLHRLNVGSHVLKNNPKFGARLTCVSTRDCVGAWRAGGLRLRRAFESRSTVKLKSRLSCSRRGCRGNRCWGRCRGNRCRGNRCWGIQGQLCFDLHHATNRHVCRHVCRHVV